MTSPRIRGGQHASDAALQAFDVAGYARRRNNVWPPADRGASGLSPYIRHGLLTLREVWDHVAGGPQSDVTKFRDELLWQEYARHLYARVGTASRASLRFVVNERTPVSAETDTPWIASAPDTPWTSSALCIQSSWNELVTDGWLTNQTRMWLASHGNVREGLGWRDGEDLMYPGGQPAGLAVDHRGAHGKGIRVLPMAGRETGAGAVRAVSARAPVSDRRVAADPGARSAGSHRPSGAT